MQPQQRRFSIRYTIVAMIVLFVIEAYLFAPRPETLAYSDFVKLVKAGKVSDVTLSSHAIEGTLAPNGLEAFLPKEKLEELHRAGKGAHRFITTRVDDPQLVRTLEAANVRFTGVPDTGWLGTLASWVVPAVVFFGLWSIMVRRMGGAGGGLLSIGKSKAKVYMDPAYASTSLSPLADQATAGVIMWVPGSVVFLAAAVWLALGALDGPHAPVRARAA